MHRILSALSLQAARLTRQRGTAIRQVAEKTSLLYFGAVDHQKDEHEVVRGLTASVHHKDKHYAVGTYDGYDIAIADRYEKTHNWCIIEVTLLRTKDVPHLFIQPVQRSNRFSHLFNGERHMAPISQYLRIHFSNEFTTRYSAFVSPQDHTHAEEWLTPAFTDGIAAHFWPHGIELKDNKLYIYITEHRLSETVLSSAIGSALWLADTLDQRSN